MDRVFISPARSVAWSIVLAAWLPAAVLGQGNLLRNADFQDDWLTLLPELKNHHWNYTTEVFNRRDYNPDGWQLQGHWEWRDADRPAPERRLVLKPGSKATQAVNLVTINQSAKLEGWPDAGGYPAATAVRSRRPLSLVRDLTLSVRLSAKNLPAGALEVRAGFSSGSPVDDPQAAKRLEVVAMPLEAGTYAQRTIELKAPARPWLAKAEKDPAFAKEGALLPMACFAELEFKTAAAGEVEVHNVELHEITLGAGEPAENLLPQGDFERVEQDRPVGWSKPEKYRYFPPGVYYIFNTWHNSNSDNRGLVRSDALLTHGGRRSLQMIVPSGDEVCVRSEPVLLNQTEPRLIEASAWVKTEQLAMLQIDAEDEQGRRLDGFNFIHKNPLSLGTNDWRLVRQVFRTAAPLKSLRLKLCARGMNGYTLDDTGHQPQQNVCGIVWWDDVRVTEPESTPTELAARGVKPSARSQAAAAPHLARLDLGERLLGGNVLSAEIVSPGREGRYRLEWEYLAPGGKPIVVRSDVVNVPRAGRATVRLPYAITEPCREAYSEYRGELRLQDEKGAVLAASPLWFGTWTVPIDLELGALYLRPEQKQFVRLNLGLAAAEMAKLKEVRLELQRRGTGEVLKTVTLPVTPTDVQRQRTKIPDGLRDDFRNLLLADLDVASLPVQPFTNPQRNWVIRATAIDQSGQALRTMTSPPFCRLGHDGPQPAVSSVRINERGHLLVNDKPWMPWGVTYGHNPVYDGPAESGKYHDLANLKPWSLYDRHGGTLADRALWDANCLRFVEGGAPLKPERLAEMLKQGLYASTVFVPPPALGKPWPADLLATVKAAPNVVAVSPGPEEAFGYFAPMSAAQLEDVRKNAQHLKQATGKPVMVGHGGYWTRLEFERVPFFDVFDPETEPLYPAPLHTDLQPLIAGQPKVVWLRPQMYESVPYERWRYHVYVELIRGARGWQAAHGPGDASTFRGLHAELRHLQPALYSTEKPPEATIEPALEHLTRRLGNKTYVIAATTHGMSFGNWRWAADESEHGRSRETADPHVFRDESDGYHATGEPRSQTLVPHGIQNLIHPRKWPSGTKLVTWVKLDKQSPPKNLTALVKADGRWTHAATWGTTTSSAMDLDALRRDNDRAFWFLRTFYRHARGFLGWGDKVPPYALAFLPAKANVQGALPPAGKWLKLELPLEKIEAAGKLLDGVAFLHESGRAEWARTSILAADGKEWPVFGDHEDRPAPTALARTKIRLAGLKAGTRVKVLFEDRELLAEDGQFIDDFRGVDLYQRYGGERAGYGNSPVALHVYEIAQ